METSGYAHAVQALIDVAELETNFASVLEAFSRIPGNDATTQEPWLWNSRSQNPEESVPASNPKENQPTQGGALELPKEKGLPPDPSVAHAPSTKTHRTKMSRETPSNPFSSRATPKVLSSRSSMHMEDDFQVGRITSTPGKAGTNPTPPLSDNREGRGKSNSKSVQSRVGSMTKRLSALNLGSRGTKEKAQGAAIEEE